MSDLTWADVPEIKPPHAEMLDKHAVTPEWAKRAGLYSATTAPATWNGYHRDKFPGLMYPWRFGGKEELQLATDDRVRHPDDKYVFRPGVDVFMNELIPVGPNTRRVLIVEGSKQHLVAAANVGSDVAVYGVGGCWNWKNMDLSCFEGLEVVVIFDGDVRTTRDVFDGAAQLKEVLELVGASSVKFALLPTSGKDGLDDFLARYPADKRPGILTRLIEKSGDLPKKVPSRKKSHPYFDDNGLMVKKLSTDIFKDHPSLLTAEKKVALYQEGAFRIDGAAFTGVVAEKLGELYRPAHQEAAEKFTVGTLYNTRRLLPVHSDEAVLNVKKRHARPGHSHSQTA